MYQKQSTKCKVDILPKHYHHHHVHQRTFWWVYLREPKVSFNVKDHTYTHIYSNFIGTPRNPPKHLAKPSSFLSFKPREGYPWVTPPPGGFASGPSPPFYWCLARWHLKSDPRILTPNLPEPKICEMFGWGKTSMENPTSKSEWKSWKKGRKVDFFQVWQERINWILRF